MLYADRVKETTSVVGIGDATLLGPDSGYVSFSSVGGVGNPFYYCIELGAEWEVGIGTLSGVSTLERSIVLVSSNANALVSFSSGVKSVFMTVAAHGFVADETITVPLDLLSSYMAQLVNLANRLMFLSMVQTTASELRVNINSGTLPTVTTVGTVNTVSSVTNQVSSGGYALSNQVMATMNQNVASAIRANISVS